MYDRFPFLESIYLLREDVYLAPFPKGGDLPRSVLDEITAIQKEDCEISSPVDWDQYFLQDLPTAHAKNLYHTWICCRFSGSVLEEILGTVDIQFVSIHGQPLLVPQVGYWTSYHHRGKGLASAALKMLMELYELPKYAALVERENIPSQRVMHKCNFTEISYDETSEYYYYECNFRS